MDCLYRDPSDAFENPEKQKLTPSSKEKHHRYGGYYFKPEEMTIEEYTKIENLVGDFRNMFTAMGVSDFFEAEHVRCMEGLPCAIFSWEPHVLTKDHLKSKNWCNGQQHAKGTFSIIEGIYEPQSNRESHIADIKFNFPYRISETQFKWHTERFEIVTNHSNPIDPDPIRLESNSVTSTSVSTFIPPDALIKELFDENRSRKLALTI